MISNISRHETPSVSSTSTTIVEVQLPAPKDSNKSLFSKIARSPTTQRRHQPVSSQGSDEFAPESANLAQAASAQSQRKQPRTESLVPVTSSLPPRPATQDGTLAIPLLARTPTLSNSNKNSNSANQAMSAPIVSEVPLAHQLLNTTNAQPSVNYLHAQIQELSHKRIATLDYLRRSHEGKIFYFNTMHLTKIDIAKIQSYTPNRLSRRATNYFLLGLSIPAVLDQHQLPHASSSSTSSSPHSAATLALEYLRSLNTLLIEFETYQTYHPTDGSHVSSLSRARLPSMFKRSGTTSRPRKSSSAIQSEIGSQISPPAVPDTPSMPQRDYLHGPNPSVDTTTTVASTTTGTSLGGSTIVNPPRTPNPSAPFANTATYPAPASPEAPNSTTLPSEPLYTHLLTPPLPFAPDFYTVFATLCDILIDSYRRILQILHSPSAVSTTVAELFSKTDARIRKVIVGGIVKDFELATRENIRKELAGIQKVVLGGLAG